MKRPFITLTIGGQECQCKLSASAVVNVESKLNESLAMKITENAVPSITFIALLLDASCKEVNMMQVLDFIDEFLDDKSFNELQTEVYKPLLESSGFFKRAGAK